MCARRRPLPLLLLLLLLLLLARPGAPLPAPPRYPLLLVAREACGARSPAAFSLPLPRNSTAAPLAADLRLLGHEETCGARWRAAVTRHALAALGAGGGVAAAGRLGARVCGAVAAAAAVLQRPQPAPCGEARARGAALAHVALLLHWRRALLPRSHAAHAAHAAQCRAALQAAERALAAAGVLVSRDRSSVVPHVVIICESSASWPQHAPHAPHASADRDVLLLRVAEPDELRRDGDYSTATRLGFQITAPSATNSYSAADNGTESKRFDAPLANRPRLLVLSDEATDVGLEDRAIYDHILEAALSHEEARRSGVEILRNNFYLHECIVADGGSAWPRLASVAVTVRQPLGAPERAAVDVAVDAAGERELRRRGAARDETNAGEPGARGALEAYAGFVALGAACALLAAGATVAWRAWRLSPRRSRASPVLDAADFQFPADERERLRVGEGMESMLSWLQRLHDVSEPEPPPERPDLLQRPEPLCRSAPSSTCSVTRLAPDNRTRYKGEPVHVRALPAAALELRRAALDALLLLQSLRHENLNPLLGCLPAPRPALVWAACARGSLEDVLVADDIALDWTFRLSLLTDLVRGMRYLHASPVRLHARLSSRNCVVDARWVLRVTDYGLPALAAAQGLPTAPRGARELLWTAPELLRAAGPGAEPGGSQAGDVFSFGIIMQEVILRGEPYCMLTLSPEEIVHKLRHPPPLIRPSVSMGAAPPDAVAVMRQCWSEQPDLRPDFSRLQDLFRHMHRGRKTNIVDSMFEMLEKYSNNLEELIKERTEQLDMEKKKTEQLLNRMLPRSVAERLLLGLRVEPEEFADVSVYFSDIVGFTALAARSTPVQVVDLLNDLYSAFDAAIEQYGVYKVETIGDAYMVVGGLPQRCADHAARVATMALHLLSEAGRFRIRHLPGAPLHLRSGLHSGACCAGVVGLTMPRYCLFGDTVNTAARMESTGAAWRVQLSGATAARLAAAGGFRLRSRGLTAVKGKGAMHTYWLLGKDGFDRPLPTPPPLESEEVLFEAEGESDGEVAPGVAAAHVQRQSSDPSPSPTRDRLAWRSSGAASAESSPPAPVRRARYLRSSASTAAGLPDTPRLSDRWASGARVLRRQWSLERGDALAAAAAESPPPPEPLGLCAAPVRAAPPRYRTRRDASALDLTMSAR